MPLHADYKSNKELQLDRDDSQFAKGMRHRIDMNNVGILIKAWV